MKTVFHVSLKKGAVYNKYDFISKITDRIKTTKSKDIKIKELDMLIKRFQIPANLNENAYKMNLSRILNKYSNRYDYLSLDGNRLYDLKFMSKFQKDIISYSIVQSTRIILMSMNKSIKDANILVDVEEQSLIISLLEELAKESKNVIVLSQDINKIEKIRESIMSEYGLSIELIYKEEDIKNIDFIITSKDKEYTCENVWYINNIFIPNTKGIYVNKILYKVPWDISLNEMPPQLIGSLIKKEKNKTILELLNSNEIRLESIMYNNNEIKLVR